MFKRLFAIALFALAVSAAPPAHASTLTIQRFVCYQTSGTYYYPGFGCEADVTGGTGSYTYTWTGSTEVYIQGYFGGYISGVCHADTSGNTVYLTITDSANATVSASRILGCYAGGQADG